MSYKRRKVKSKVPNPILVGVNFSNTYHDAIVCDELDDAFDIAANDVKTWGERTTLVCVSRAVSNEPRVVNGEQ